VGLFYSPLLRYFWEEMTDEEWEELYQSMVMTLNGISMCDCGNCEGVLECIQDNPDVRNAIAGLFLDNTTEGYYERLLEKLKEDLEEPVTPVNPAPDCNDNLWGAIRNFVDILTQDCTDFFELIQANPSDQALDIINALANLPVIDEIGVDVITEFVTWAVDQLGVYYNASLTDEYKDQLACDIFCRVKDTCQVSVEDVNQVLIDRVNPAFNLENLIDILQNVIEFTFVGAGDFVVDVWLFTALRFATLADYLWQLTGQKGEAYATTRYRKQLMLGLNNPDSDWILLCGDCPPSVQAFIDVNAGTILLNGNTVSGTPTAVGYRYDVEDGDTVQVSISGQIGVRFNTSDPNIFNPADPLARIEITSNGGGDDCL